MNNVQFVCVRVCVCVFIAIQWGPGGSKSTVGAAHPAVTSIGTQCKLRKANTSAA